MKDFLPVSKEDMEARGWYYLDYIIVTGDAYVDHPSFGAALIGRLLESRGYRVGIVAQPDWKNTVDFAALGRPRYAFLITAGNLDSMVANYTAGKHKRTEDDYSPGGKAGLRPDRACIVYANRVREAFPDVPVVLGGIEASLRRLAHYDYWDDKVRRSILIDARAPLLVYGMGEQQILEIAERLKKGEAIEELNDIRGTAFVTRDLSGEKNMLFSYKTLPSFQEMAENKLKYAEAFRIQYLNQNPYTGQALVQEHDGGYVVQNPPARPLSEKEMDELYSLPFMRAAHPKYAKQGGVPALQEVEFSITSHRGCFGGCAFCALNFHQGRLIQKRSAESILTEIRQMTKSENFKGIIHDIGGPTANFRNPACRGKRCTERLCLYPEKCNNLQVDHAEYIDLLRKARSIPGVKKVFVRSGVRFDYLMADRKRKEILKELCEHHVSGLLKVAPEHVAAGTLQAMRKPPKQVFTAFRQLFYDVNKSIGKEQYLVPYFIAGHPGTTLKDAVELAEYVRDLGYNPEQVQDFTPTPGSLATCMYYTGIDPLTGKKVYVPKSEKERRMQRALLQYRDPKNHPLVREALRRAGREDLIGYGPKALVRPAKDTAKEKAIQKRKGKGPEGKKAFSGVGKRTEGKRNGHRERAAGRGKGRK